MILNLVLLAKGGIRVLDLSRPVTIVVPSVISALLIAHHAHEHQKLLIIA